MNLYIKKLHRDGTLWVIILYLLLSLIVASICFYQAKQKELNILSRGLYNEHSIYFMLSENNLQKLDWEKVSTSQPYTLFKELQNEKENIRAIYYKGETYIPPIISGRYFEETDFYNNHRYAVVGKEVDNSKFLTKGGKQYFTYQGENFEIIGIMGASYHSKIDTTILLNLDIFDSSENFQSSIYVLNTQDRNSILQNDSLRMENGTLNVYEFDRGDSGAQRYIDTNIYQKIIILTVALLLITSSMLFATNWIKEKKQEIRSLWIIGINPKVALRKYTFQYYVITLICYLFICGISFLLIFSFNQSKEIIKTYLNHILIGSGLILMASYFSISITVKNMKRQAVRKGLK